MFINFRAAIVVACVVLLAACSTKFSTDLNKNTRTLYLISEQEAFSIARQAIVDVMPGRKIIEIDGSIKGYSTYVRFFLDTYSQQVMIFPAKGIDQQGDEVTGVYFEVSGSGSSFIRGRATNVNLYETLVELLRKTDSAVETNDVQSIGYSKDVFGKQERSIVQSDADKLRDLKDLFDEGVITAEEFERKKIQLLDDF